MKRDDKMKRVILLIFIACLCLFSLTGCSPQPQGQIAATTLPVYEFTSRLCQGTDLQVTRLVTENVSCLHDYTLTVGQVKALESAETVVISGAGLEAFLSQLAPRLGYVIDSSGHSETPAAHHDHDHDHDHETEAHLWLSPDHAMEMCRNICAGLITKYPQYQICFEENLAGLLSDLQNLKEYGLETLKDLSCREIITFHDGFSCLAESFDLQILRAVEEESGSEASARELIELTQLIRDRSLSSIFTERSGSTSAAQILARETGVAIYTLDMAIAGDSYFDAMYHNIDTLKEALQ